MNRNKSVLATRYVPEIASRNDFQYTASDVALNNTSVVCITQNAKLTCKFPLVCCALSPVMAPTIESFFPSIRSAVPST